MVGVRFPGQDKLGEKDVAARSVTYYRLLKRRFTDAQFLATCERAAIECGFFPLPADLLTIARNVTTGTTRVLSMEEAHDKQKALEARWVNGGNVMAEIRRRAELLQPAAMKALPPRRHTFAMLPAADPFEAMSDEEFERRKGVALERASVALGRSGEAK